MAGQPVTMNLQDSGEGMVPFGSSPSPAPPPLESSPPIAPSSRPSKEPPSVSFTPGLKNPVDNIKESMTMDSTPIDEVLSPEEMQGPPPQMMPTQMPASQGAMMMQPQIAQQSQAAPGASANPLNLTDEQFQAVLVAVSAAIAFSNPIQDKLGTTIPNFLVDGERGTSGLMISGVVAALVFYFIRKFMLKA